MKLPVQYAGIVHIVKEKIIMGKLIIDGNSVYEIDEECVKRNRIPKECQIYEHLQQERSGRREKGRQTRPDSAL